MNKVIEELFYSIREGTPGVYKEMPVDDENDKNYDALMNKFGLDLDAQNAFFDVYATEASFAERHGFEQGLKLGFKLAFEIFADKE